MWTILARHGDTQDEHLWFGMGFTRMSQSAVLEWIEMLRWSNIDLAPLHSHYDDELNVCILFQTVAALLSVEYHKENENGIFCLCYCYYVDPLLLRCYVSVQAYYNLWGLHNLINLRALF